MNSILALTAGLFISLMIFFNGSLEGHTGSFLALLCIHLSGFLFSVILPAKKEKPQRSAKMNPWNLCAGLLGIGVVILSNRVFIKGGVLLTLGGTLAGQVITAGILEFFQQGDQKKPLYPGKLISILLTVTGGIIIAVVNGLPLLWIFISWIPGVLIMVQSHMNSRNVLVLGFRGTLLVHYGSVLAVLLPLMFLFPSWVMNVPMEDSLSSGGLSILRSLVQGIISGELPWLFSLGGGALGIGVICLGSYLLHRMSPVTYVLLLYCGQLGGAIILDYNLGHPLVLEKILALVLIIIGLLLGELKVRRMIPAVSMYKKN